MTCFQSGSTIDLAKRDNLPLYDVQGALLRVTRGTLWVTQENDTRDLVLRAGDTWVVERSGLTIVEAQADSTFCVGGRHVDTVLKARRASIAPRMSAWARLRNAAVSLFAPPPPRTIPYF